TPEVVLQLQELPGVARVEVDILIGNGELRIPVRGDSGRSLDPIERAQLLEESLLLRRLRLSGGLLRPGRGAAAGEDQQRSQNGASPTREHPFTQLHTDTPRTRRWLHRDPGPWGWWIRSGSTHRGHGLRCRVRDRNDRQADSAARR